MTNGPQLLFFALLLGGCVTSTPERVTQGTGGSKAPVMGAPPTPPPPVPNRLMPDTYVGTASGVVTQLNQLAAPLNAVIALNPNLREQAVALQEGGATRPTFGVFIKDNIETRDQATTAGSLALAANDTGRDAPIVAKLRTAGALILGKTNLSEWANIRSTNSISGWSAVGGQTRNPYALDRNTCGSSSGSGAVVASGLADYAIGTETDGSITCPASMTGVVGLKPTVGLVSRTHIIPISESQDTAGPMTRTVRQAAELLTVIAGSDPADPATADAERHKTDYVAALTPDALRGQRIAVLRFAGGFGTDPLFEQAIATLRAAGAELVEVKTFKPSGNFGEDEFRVLLTEFKAGVNAYLRSSPAPLPARDLAGLIAFNKTNAPREMPLFEQEIFEMAEKTTGVADPGYTKARANSLRIAKADLDRLLGEQKAVALVFPTRPAAWKIDAVHGDVSPGGNSIGSMAAVAGYPHLTVPMGPQRGLPVGLSFVGPRWSEARLLALGNAFELARGPLPRPRFLPSIETSTEVAPALKPQRP